MPGVVMMAHGVVCTTSCLCVHVFVCEELCLMHSVYERECQGAQCVDVCGCEHAPCPTCGQKL